jgi:hypothetical protein
VKNASANANDDGRIELELGGGRAGYDDRLAECNDHEQLEALSEMGSLHLPGVRGKGRPPGQPVEHQRGAVVDRQRRQPQAGALGPVGEPTCDPEHAGGEKPGEDSAGAFPLDRAPPGGREGEKGVAANLDRNIGAGEEQRPAAERFRDRDRHDQAGQHDPKQDQLNNDRVRVQLIRDPGGVVPRPPHHHQHQQGLARTLPRQVIQQQMRHLRDREHEHQVVEQLQHRHPLLHARQPPTHEPAHHPRTLAHRQAWPGEDGGIAGAFCEPGVRWAMRPGWL